MATERYRVDVIKKEEIFLDAISEFNAEDLIFIDEAGVNLGMTRKNARSAKGKRAECKRSGARQSNISLAGAISLQGMIALYPYDGSIDGERFLSFLDVHLLPKIPEGKVIVMDNLRVHHIPAVKERLQKAGVRLIFLPPYSPEYNPIEEAWSVVKNVFRSLEARSISSFVDVLTNAQATITGNKSRGFFEHAGYILPV